GDRVGARALLARGDRDPDPRLRALPQGGRGADRLMDVALSPNGRRLMRVFFALVIVFLYAPIAILLVFSFNRSPVPVFPLIGHIVISVPYTILVIRPRLGQIDASLGEAAYDLGAGPLTTFRTVTLPLILPAVVSAFMIAFTISFDEFPVASFLVGPRQTFPVYLYAALRFPSQLPQVIAVAVVVLLVSLAVIVRSEEHTSELQSRFDI